MRINFAEIFEGWRNHLVPPEHLKEHIAQVSSERLEICATCPYNSKNTPMNGWLTDLYEHCTECGCPLTVKSKCLSCGCGYGKWLPVLTEDEEDILNAEYNGTEEGHTIEEDSPAAVHRDVDGGVR